MTNAKLTSVYLSAVRPTKPWTDERDYEYRTNCCGNTYRRKSLTSLTELHDPTIPNIDLFGGYDEHGKKIKGASLEIRLGECIITLAYGGIHGAIQTMLKSPR